MKSTILQLLLKNLSWKKRQTMKFLHFLKKYLTKNIGRIILQKSMKPKILQMQKVSLAKIQQ